MTSVNKVVWLLSLVLLLPWSKSVFLPMPFGLLHNYTCGLVRCWEILSGRLTTVFHTVAVFKPFSRCYLQQHFCMLVCSFRRLILFAMEALGTFSPSCLVSFMLFSNYYSFCCRVTGSSVLCQVCLRHNYYICTICSPSQIWLAE